MAIGRIISIPEGASKYAIARDEHGNNRSVDQKELPRGARAGDDFAYRLDFNPHNGTPTLVKDEFSED